MDHYPKIGDTVKILNDIGKEFDDDRIGEVIGRDGEYIDIRLKKSNVLIERYICELELISQAVKNDKKET